MAYWFKPSDKNVACALRRIACGEIDKAIAAIERTDDLHEGIHDARKKCKKLRGLIRLVGPAFPDYTSENIALRNAANHLGLLRERGAGLETLDRLLASPPGKIDLEAAGTIHAALEKNAAAGEMHDLEPRIAAFRVEMVACRKRAKGWTLNDTDISVIAAGLKRTYSKARKNMELARQTRTPENLHNWRKQVKYHWYHARLLRPVNPDKIRRQIEMARGLSDILGDHHDLVDFQTLLESGNLPRKAGAALLPLVAAEMSRLETAAFNLGPKLLDDSPKRLSEKWHHWLKKW